MTTKSHSSVYEKIKFFHRVNSLKEFLNTDKNSFNYKNTRIQKIETLTLILDKIEQKIKENKNFIS